MNMSGAWNGEEAREVVPISRADDPRVADYLDIRERDLVGRRGRLVIEGKVVLEALVSPASRARAVSVLIAEHRIETLWPMLQRLPSDVPILAAAQSMMDAVVGFPIHRGILAIAEKPPSPTLSQVFADVADQALILVASQVSNHDNLGGLLRNAAAFGAHAVMLDDGCSDPFYRKAIRVSVGAALRLPIVLGHPIGALLDALDDAGFETLALTPSGRDSVAELRPGGRRALLVGAEGPGLSAAVMARRRTVAIPMHAGFDSLNVATAAAVALSRLSPG